MGETHTVTNQPPPLSGYNIFSSDRALVEALAREDASGDRSEIEMLGELAGSAQAIAWGFDANEHPPELHTHDRFGNRIDEVTFHPSWHRLMETATGYGAHAAAWREARPGAHVARAAKFFVWSQVEAGHVCPISMTYAAVAALRVQPEVAAEWEPPLTARSYDPLLRPIARKQSALCGMALTEKQGGSDVRANQTEAVFDASGPLGDAYALTGHKWFCSAPMCDAFVALAQTPEGLTCFLVPRILPDGTRNTILLQRLKDKLGNRSNATAEIEFDRTWAVRIGESGRGVRTIVEMINCTRLDCINGSAALMRQAVAQAVHHATHRVAFGRTLVDHPLMQNVLADIALESEAATTLLMRLAGAADRAPHDPHESLVKRLGTAVGKYYVCKRGPTVVAEALECLGGNGYVEESILPRLYREAPVNAVWEGSGNVNALDVLRVLAKQPESIEAFFDEIRPARSEARIDSAAQALRGALRDPSDAEARARILVERMATLWQAALLIQHAPAAVSDAFVASRIAGEWGHTLGTLPPNARAAQIVARARPLG